MQGTRQRDATVVRRRWASVLVPDGDEMRERPTVVLVYGGPGVYDHSYFKPHFAPLAEHAQVVYLDLRDHGRSQRGDASEWNAPSRRAQMTSALFGDTAGIAGPIVFGHSMGAPPFCSTGATP